MRCGCGARLRPGEVVCSQLCARLAKSAAQIGADAALAQAAAEFIESSRGRRGEPVRRAAVAYMNCATMMMEGIGRQELLVAVAAAGAASPPAPPAFRATRRRLRP